MAAAVGLLAGGLSTRMGFKKELAPFRGKPIIGLLADCLVSLGYKVYVAVAQGDSPRFSGLLPPGVVLLEDEVPQRSPLNGLYTLLCGSGVDCLFLLSGDSPIVDGRLISDALDLCSRGFSAVLPAWRGGRVDTVHGAYSSSVAAGLERSLGHSADLSLMRFIRELDPVAFLEAERYGLAVGDVDSRAEWGLLRGLYNGRGCLSQP